MSSTQSLNSIEHSRQRNLQRDARHASRGKQRQKAKEARLAEAREAEAKVAEAKVAEAKTAEALVAKTSE